MKQSKKDYKVLASFKWRGRWSEVGEVLSLLPAEAQQLLRMKKIELLKGAATTAIKTTSASLILSFMLVLKNKRFFSEFRDNIASNPGS